MTLAFMYAGQGSQHAGMGADLYGQPAFREVFDACAEAVDFDLKKVCFEDPDGLIDRTEYTQPCMVAFAAGVFDPVQAVRLVAFRGKAMAQAAEGIDCGMMAVLNLDAETLEAICAEVSECGLGHVQATNYNCPGQIVISGHAAAVERAAERAKEAGARRCLPLNVSGPFHTVLMSPAGSALAERFRGETFGEMRVPVLFNCLGREKPESLSIPELLVRQVQSPVRMEETIRRLAELSVDTVIEIGPGKALSGFIRKTAPEIRTIPCETLADLENLKDVIDF
ncbi:MAG: ACP S-malonyltransferase [Lachnospiraceae bacterium]|nr:ACP S-malonyltransferase [Lachnospiraceae bacterium]